MKKMFALLLVCLLLAGTGAAYERKSPRNGNKPTDTDRLEVRPEERAGEDEGFDIVISFTGDMMLASLKNETTTSNSNAYADRHEPSYFLQNV